MGHNFDSADANLADLEVKPQTSVCFVGRLLQIRPTQSVVTRLETFSLMGLLEFYFVAGMAVLCLLAVWDCFKRIWDPLDARWTGSQASSVVRGV